MSILSNVDIEKELGINIFIYPFSKRKLRGASYNLTVSKLAWELKNKTSIYDQTTGRVVIPSTSTVLIQTNETVWVSSKIAGTYHSKVALVSKGLSHIGTTLDPEYIGSSLIALHNYSEQDIDLIAEKDTFVTLVFYYVATEASIKTGNQPGRPDILRGFQISQEESEWLDEEFRNVPESLKIKLNECPDFQEIYQRREAEKQRLISIERANSKVQRQKRNSFTIYGILAFVFAGLIVSLIYLSSNKEKYSSKPWYDPTINVIYSLLLVIPGSFMTKVFTDLSTK